MRSVLPSESDEIRAVVIRCHGLNGHNNTRHSVANWERLAESGLAIFGIDVIGHGYSDGTRALVNDWNDVFDDFERFIEVLVGRNLHFPPHLNLM